MPGPTHQPPAPDETIVFFGDSVTDCGRRDDPDHLGHGYVRLLAEGPLREHRVVNVGIGGNRVSDLQQRLVDDVVAARPDLVSVLIGINDTAGNCRGTKPVSLEDYEVGYRDVLARISEAGARTVLMEPFLLGITDEHVDWRKDLNPRIEVVHKLASEIGAPVVPVDQELNRLAAEQGAESLAADGVHPTPAGHQVVAALWAKTILNAG